MKLKYKFVIREVSGQSVAVAVGTDYEKFNGMVKLNKTGAYIMELLNSGDKSQQELVTALTDRYEVTAERAEANVKSFLDILRQGGLLRES